MIRRTVWVGTLIAALLFVLPAFGSTTQTDRSATVTALQPGARQGTQPAPDPMPNSGGGPTGDDDTPNRDGVGASGAASRDRICAPDGRKIWSLGDLSAWLQRHVLYVLRAQR